MLFNSYLFIQSVFMYFSQYLCTIYHQSAILSFAAKLEKRSFTGPTAVAPVPSITILYYYG